ncbi:MAG: ABC transporter substrate-binding protein, partial [Porticoccaceae bacterium]|nr:ABC transporter substrate-binding protein [Porticoccaceae bacterium]
LLNQFRAELKAAAISSDNVIEETSEKTPKVLFILGHGGGAPMVAGEQTSADTMIRLAGGRNVFTGFTGYKPMTAEAIVRANPDIVLLTTQGRRGLGNSDGVLKLPGIGFTEAGRQQRILDYDALLLLGFGLRTPQVVQQMRADMLRVMEL